jgi:hypothetical protein
MIRDLQSSIDRPPLLMPLFPMYSLVCLSPSHFRPPLLSFYRLERVILRRHLTDKVLPNDRQLDEDILSDFGDFAEEEEGEDAG